MNENRRANANPAGPVVLQPDIERLGVVGLPRKVAESYVPLNIAVSYAEQDGTVPMIINWLRVGKDWKFASEIILPVPPHPPEELRASKSVKSEE